MLRRLDIKITDIDNYAIIVDGAIRERLKEINSEVSNNLFLYLHIIDIEKGIAKEGQMGHPELEEQARVILNHSQQIANKKNETDIENKPNQ